MINNNAWNWSHLFNPLQDQLNSLVKNLDDAKVKSELETAKYILGKGHGSHFVSELFMSYFLCGL